MVYNHIIPCLVLIKHNSRLYHTPRKDRRIAYWGFALCRAPDREPWDLSHPWGWSVAPTRRLRASRGCGEPSQRPELSGGTRPRGPPGGWARGWADPGEMFWTENAWTLDYKLSESRLLFSINKHIKIEILLTKVSCWNTKWVRNSLMWDNSHKITM